MNPPRWRVPSHWGFCFAGNEDTFCAALDLALANTEQPFRYLEIGLGLGVTLRSVQSYLIQSGANFRCIGVDIPACHPSARESIRYPFPGLVEIHLNGAESYLKDCEPVNFAFIDGCHGAACVKSDFLGVERVIVPRGIVVFHDTDIGCQGLHFQHHCGTGIEARAALTALGLLAGRPGWQLIAETSGDKEQSGHGISVFQKT